MNINERATSPIETLSVEQLHLLLDHLQGIVGYFDTHNRCIYANHAYAKAYHTQVTQMLGRHIREIIGEPAWIIVEPHSKRVLSGEVVRYVREIDAATDDAHWIDVHLVPNHSETGQVIGNFVFIEDVTQQHRAAIQVRESEARIERFMQAGSEGIVFYRDGLILDCNEALARLLGLQRQQLIGREAASVFLPQDRENAARIMHAEPDKTYAALLQKQDGTHVSVEITGRHLQMDGRATSVATVRDISSLDKTRDALLRSQARYRTLVESSDQAAVFVDDKEVLFANPAAEKLFDMKGSGLLGLRSVHLIHPDDREQAMSQGWQAVSEQGQQEVIIRVLTPPSEHLQPNTRISWVRVHGSFVDWDGRGGLLVFMTDITQLHESEAQMRKALAQERELGDLKTRFVSMASHEFRTPLAAIQSSAELLEHYMERLTQEQRTEALTDIQNAVSRMQQMTESFLAFGRISAGSTALSLQALRIVPLLTDLMRQLQNSQYPEHHLTLALQEPVNAQCALMLDELLLQQMLGNLLSNACKYSAPGAKVRLNLSQVQSLGRDCLQIQISDEGIGIPAEELPLLFESFHRASNVGQVAGTGLGLAIVDRAARAHGGSVSVRSVLGAGSVFTLLLPWNTATDLLIA